MQGSNIPGTKNIPAAETVLVNGKRKSDAEIMDREYSYVNLQNNYIILFF